MADEEPSYDSAGAGKADWCAHGSSPRRVQRPNLRRPRHQSTALASLRLRSGAFLGPVSDEEMLRLPRGDIMVFRPCRRVGSSGAGSFPAWLPVIRYLRTRRVCMRWRRRRFIFDAQIDIAEGSLRRSCDARRDGGAQRQGTGALQCDARERWPDVSGGVRTAPPPPAAVRQQRALVRMTAP